MFFLDRIYQVHIINVYKRLDQNCLSVRQIMCMWRHMENVFCVCSTISQLVNPMERMRIANTKNALWVKRWVFTIAHILSTVIRMCKISKSSHFYSKVSWMLKQNKFSTTKFADTESQRIVGQDLLCLSRNLIMFYHVSSQKILLY